MFKKYKGRVAAVIMEPVIGQRGKYIYKKSNSGQKKIRMPINDCEQVKTLKFIKNLAKKN